MDPEEVAEEWMDVIALEKRVEELRETIRNQEEFDDMDALTQHLDDIIYVRDKLFKRGAQIQKEQEEQEKTLETLKDRFDQLRRLEEARSEADKWEKEWKKIQEASSKKRMEEIEIALGILDLYVTIFGEEGAGDVEPEQQLEKIKDFIVAHQNIMADWEAEEKKKAESKKKAKAKKK